MNTPLPRTLLAASLFFLGVAVAFAQQPTPLLTQSAEQCLNVIKSDSASQKAKADACLQLAVIGSPEAIGTLAALLPDEKMNHMARYAMEPIPGPAVDAAFREALSSLKGRPLVGVIGSIGVRRDKEAVPTLTKLLLDSNQDAAQASARAMGQIATPAAAAALRRALTPSSGSQRLAVCEGLLRCAEQFGNEGQRKQAAAIYDELRSLEGPPHVRVAATRGAILIRGQDGISLLRQELNAADFVAFSAAVRTAYEISGPDITKVLAGELARISDTDRKILVIQALGQRPDTAGLTALTTVARSGPKPVRLAATLALAETGNGAAAGPLAGLTVDEDRDVAQAALDGLAGLRNVQADTVVLSMLKGESTPQRLAAIELVGRRKMSGCMGDLLRASTDPDTQVRPAALSTLGELGRPEDLPALLEVLPKLQAAADLDAAEQALAALCAKAERPERCADPLISTLAQVQPAQKSVLIRVLGGVGGRSSLDAVRAGVKDSNAEVHAAAIRTLGAWKTAEAAPDLLALAKNAPNATDQTLSLRSYLGLASNPDIPVNDRLGMCRDASALVKTEEEKRLWLSALGSTESVDALPLILPHLEQPGTKEEAAAAVLAVATKALKADLPAPGAKALSDALQKVAQATTNEDLVKRAKALAGQAEKKAK